MTICCELWGRHVSMFGSSCFRHMPAKCARGCLCSDMHISRLSWFGICGVGSPCTLQPSTWQHGHCLQLRPPFQNTADSDELTSLGSEAPPPPSAPNPLGAVGRIPPRPRILISACTPCNDPTRSGRWDGLCSGRGHQRQAASPAVDSAAGARYYRREIKHFCSTPDWEI